MSDLIDRAKIIKLLDEQCWNGMFTYFRGEHHVNCFRELVKAIPPVEREWIPISSINEIPKEGAYWVTFEYENGYRETSHIGWDKFHKRWDDEEGWALDDGDYIIAYMPYFEPEPYNPKSE